MRQCYPVYTAGPCMKPWQVAALGVFTVALTVAWLPVIGGSWVVRRCRD